MNKLTKIVLHKGVLWKICVTEWAYFLVLVAYFALYNL
jgi:hypothetical protein